MPGRPEQDRISRLDSFDLTASECPKIPFTGSEYINWLHAMLEELPRTVQRIAQSAQTDLPTAWGKPGEPLLTTNHYRLLCQPGGKAELSLVQTTCARFNALCDFFANYRADRAVADEELLYILSDSRVIQDMTAQHIVMRPRTPQIRLFVPRRFLSDGQA